MSNGRKPGREAELMWWPMPVIPAPGSPRQEDGCEMKKMKLNQKKIKIEGIFHDRGEGGGFTYLRKKNWRCH